MPDGAVKIIDWGALLKGTRDSIDAPSVWTPAYAPPETVDHWMSIYVTYEGQAHSYDVYAIGLMHLEMINPSASLGKMAEISPLLQPGISNMISHEQGEGALKTLAEDISFIEAALALDPRQRPTPAELREWMAKLLGATTPEVLTAVEARCFQEGTQVQYRSKEKDEWHDGRVESAQPSVSRCTYELAMRNGARLKSSGGGGDSLRLRQLEVDLNVELLAKSESESETDSQYMLPLGVPLLESQDAGAQLEGREMPKGALTEPHIPLGGLDGQRMDPSDSEVYTWSEFVMAYRGQQTLAELIDYWLKECEPVAGASEEAFHGHRIDPFDYKLYTWSDFSSAYDTSFSPDQLEVYWLKTCREVPSTFPTEYFDPAEDKTMTWSEIAESMRDDDEVPLKELIEYWALQTAAQKQNVTDHDKSDEGPHWFGFFKPWAKKELHISSKLLNKIDSKLLNKINNVLERRRLE
eukprot:TRINITY_DN27045_c0_g1_i3.p1 TRINITY_DN27045_c0_g1~~TRINITY_DN27045_c0_g1_i3.p1  ORF type:complete len:467 (-),score=81.39 TRINITY_DN27045_c0_g1_i3:90-1490(-)